AGQDELGLSTGDALSTPDQEYNQTPIINEIRDHVSSWRNPPAGGTRNRPAIEFGDEGTLSSECLFFTCRNQGGLRGISFELCLVIRCIRPLMPRPRSFASRADERPLVANRVM